MKNNKHIFSPAIAGELLDQGFIIIDKCRNYKDPSKWVYFFEDTDELEEAFDKILTARGARK